jgi:hypothetical protein
MNLCLFIVNIVIDLDQEYGMEHNSYFLRI